MNTDSDFDPLDIQSVKENEEFDQNIKDFLARQEAEDLKWLMSDKRGRRIVWGLLSKTGVFRSSFTGNSETFFREGMRNIGLMYMTDINVLCPERYHTMVKEQQEHEQRIDRKLRTK